MSIRNVPVNEPPIIDPDGSTDGWVPPPDGAVVVGEPQGAPYDIAITVPAGRVAGW